MDLEARKIRKFLNVALHLAHAEVRDTVPNFFDFKKKLKNKILDANLSADEKGHEMLTISMGKNGRVKVEIISDDLEGENALLKLRNIMLDTFAGKIN